MFNPLRSVGAEETGIRFPGGSALIVGKRPNTPSLPQLKSEQEQSLQRRKLNTSKLSLSHRATCRESTVVDKPMGHPRKKELLD